MGILGDTWGSVRDAGSSVFGYNTRAENEAQEASEQATQAGESERQRLAQQSQALQDGVEGYEDPGIMQCENWSAYSHEDLYKTNQESIDEGSITNTADAWTKLGSGLRERGPQFDSKLQSIISEGWQGEAADQAKTIGRPTAQWMEGSGNAFELTGNRLSQAGSGAGQVKQMVPEPQGHSWGRTAASAIPFGIAGGGADAVAQMNERKEAENAAREAMGRVYSPTLTEVDSQVPQFQKPDGSIAKPGDSQRGANTNWGNGDASGQNVPSGTSSGIGDGAGGGAGGGAGAPATPGMPGGPGGVPGGPGGPGTGNPGGPGLPGGPLPGGPGSPPPDGTTPDWVDPPGGPGNPVGPGGPGTPGGPGNPGGPGQYGPGGGNNLVGGLPGGGSAGGAGAGGGAAARGAGAAGGAGALGAGAKSGAGNLAGAGGPAAGGAGAGRGAGAGGGAGRGGMMGGAPMGGRGAGQEGDDEHQRPSWLEENDDIWLNDMPKTAPPVLGG